MSAKEMFEELNYYLVFEDYKRITYKLGNISDDNQNYKALPKKIHFYKQIKEIDFEYGRLGSYLYFYLLQAINKQVEELGWNER